MDDSSVDDDNVNNNIPIIYSVESIHNCLNPLSVHEIYISDNIDCLPDELKLLSNLTKLTAVNGNISRIENLHLCKNLSFLNLSGNEISRIKNLDNNINITCLVLDYNPITCIQANDIQKLQKLEKLYLCGTMIDNLWMTASALKNLPNLSELAFCKFDGNYMKSLLQRNGNVNVNVNDEKFNNIQNEVETGTIIDMIARHIGDVTFEEIGGRINNISENFTEKLSQTDWTTIGHMSERIGLSEFPHKIINLGEKLERPEIVNLGERLDKISIPVALGYLSTLRNHVSEVTNNGASSIGKILSSIQDVINSDSNDFFLDDQSSSSEISEDFDFWDSMDPQISNKFSSPICLEKSYTEFFVHHLKQLKYFDGIKINDDFRLRASEIYFSLFQDVNWTFSGNRIPSTINSILSWECGYDYSGKSICTSKYRKNICRSLVSKYEQPKMTQLSLPNHSPRQFEYHPNEENILVYGTLTGELVLLNTAKRKMISEIVSSSPSPILGISWFKRNKQYFISGSSDGSLGLYNTGLENGKFINNISCKYEYDSFNSFTSLNVNANDKYFLTSGYSTSVKLYDIATGKIAGSYKDLHSKHINVLRFANHDPNIFATSSFDEEVKLWDLRDMTSPIFGRRSNKGNIMVCFSPDDKYILSSAIDNEVRQYTTYDGRLHLNLNIKRSYSKYNYTRSYYMNGGDYIIIGSCQEGIVRIYNASDGKFVRDVLLSYEQSNDYYCQSLRADPSRPFTLSILLANQNRNSPLDLREIDILQKLT